MQKNLTMQNISCSQMEELLGVIAALRGENGCPWDRKQTLESLKPYLVEECCELLDALEQGGRSEHCDELGDVLLQVLLQSRIREEEGAFDFCEVAAHLRDKLIRRHPHVFGSMQAETAEEVVRNWNEIKKAERGDAPPKRTLEGLPSELPALLRAQRIQSRAAKVGFDWDEITPVLAKVREEIQEVEDAIDNGDISGVKEELGDLLFAVVNVCRFQKIDAEAALRSACAKFARRFHQIEDALVASGERIEDCDLERLDQIWDAIKTSEKIANQILVL